MALLGTYINAGTSSPAAGAVACITHGLPTTPDWVGLTPVSQADVSTPAIISSKNATSFNITGGGAQVGLDYNGSFWHAIIR